MQPDRHLPPGTLILMASDSRIPPGVTLAFEKAATQICNDAKLDYDEWPLRAYETVTHLQERWRDGILKGLSTDEAERQALNAFGKLSAVARSLRKPVHPGSVYQIHRNGV